METPLTSLVGSQLHECLASCTLLAMAGPTEIPFSSILFEELLHKGTFKVVHHATVTDPMYGMMSVPVAVKRLRGAEK